MNTLYVDFVVIGSGPSGQKAAIQAAKLGQKVVIIDKEAMPGGVSLNSGTIPSKSLREAIIDLSRYNERSFSGYHRPDEVTVADLNYRLQTILDGERAILLRQFKKNGISFLSGTASFLSPHHLLLQDRTRASTRKIEAKVILIATGSLPRNPMNVPFDQDVIVDSTQLLAFNRIPKTMIVLGGGIIGSEYASFFAILGSKVLVLDKRQRLLSDLDAEIGIHLQAGLKENGLEFIPKKVPISIKRVENRAVVACEDGSVYEADTLLYALGREANVKSLHIEKAGLNINARGYLSVNEYFQTQVPHIYAAGDVIGYPALASTSMEQGRLVARHAFGASTHLFPKLFPIGIYTIPEISCIGTTEEQLIQKGQLYDVGRAYYYEIAKSHITGSSNFGLFKLLFHPQTREILGVHIVGRSATELIHIGQVAMAFNAKIDFFVDQVFNYPTFAEGYRIAALNGLNKIKPFAS